MKQKSQGTFSTARAPSNAGYTHVPDSFIRYRDENRMQRLGKCMSLARESGCRRAAVGYHIYRQTFSPVLPV
jgi:hypothetical protein